METVNFAPDLIEYAFLGVSLSDAKFMGGEYSNESRNVFALVKILAFAPLFNTQKNHVLNCFALEMAAIIVARGGTAENRERVVEGTGIFHKY